MKELFLLPTLPQDLRSQDLEWLMTCIEERLRPHIADVPKAYRKMQQRYCFPRDCFGRALQFIHGSPHLPNALYVFGEALSGGLGQHGWVEINDIVFDGVMQEFYHKAGYYQADCAEPWYRFTRPAVMYMLRKMDAARKRGEDLSACYRWEWTLKLPWAHDKANPLLVDLDRCKNIPEEPE